MADVLMVKMAEARRDGAVAHARALWHQAASDLALLFFPFVGFLLVIADRLIVLLFTASYAQSVPIFRVSVLLILFYPPLVESVLRVYADTRFILASNLLQLGVMSLLIWPLLRRFGLVGGVLVMLIAAAVVRVLGLIRLKRLMDSSLADLLPWANFAKVTLIAIGASLAAAGVESAVAAPPFATIAMAGAAHVLVWALLAWRFGFVPTPSVASIRARLGRGLPKLDSQHAE
jgi:O-antigen/teichoic acid export membrane protein